MPVHSLQHLGGGRFTAEKEPRVLLLERGQPPVRRIDHRPQQPGEPGLVAGDAAGRLRPCGGQQFGGRCLPPGDRDEQIARWPGQAQRGGQ